jgi:hypothetical protein
VLKGLKYNNVGCIDVIVTPLGGSGGSPPRFGGSHLVVTTLWKCVLDIKFTSTSSSRSIITYFLPPKLTWIIFKSIMVSF